MTQLETELNELKDDVLDMMNLVQSQMKKAREALFNLDTDLAEEIFAKDKKVNAADLTIDKQSERILALYNPVAVDLRFVMSCLQANTFLERIGDNAKGIVGYVSELKENPSTEFLDELRVHEMFDRIEEMIEIVIDSYENEDSDKVRKIFKKDKKLNEINGTASAVALKQIAKKPELGADYLYFLSVVRKLERAGDLTKNLAEEIIYYIDAKKLKHKNKKA